MTGCLTVSACFFLSSESIDRVSKSRCSGLINEIGKPEDWDRTPDPKKYFVQFFGTEEIAFVALEILRHLLVRVAAKNTSGSRDDRDRTAPESEAPSVDGVGDDRVEDDLKDGIGTGEPDDQDVKPATSAHANDNLSPAIFSEKKNKASNGARTPKETESTSSPDKPFYVKEEIPNNSNEEDIICTGRTQVATPMKGSNSCHDNVEGGSSSCWDDGQKDGVPSLMVSTHAKSPGGGQRALTMYENAGGSGDLPETGGHFKDGTQSKIASGGSMKESSPDTLKSDSDITSGKRALKAKKAIKDCQAYRNKKYVSCLKVDNSMASEAETGTVGSDVPGDEDVLPLSKRRRRALEAMSDSATLTPEVKIEKNSVVLKNDALHSKSAKPLHTQLKRKRRTICRFEDDDDEEPKTPVHGPSRNVNTPSRISNSIKDLDAHHESSYHTQLSVRDSGGHEESPSKECSPRLQQTVEKRPKKTMAAPISHSPRKLESEKLSSRRLNKS
ncbi:hypothetical protein CK203_035774 [Vitis vinifera]|uniref:Uncharacterized protein n=1 Tax=Vitis vinifera TaxID=29760 RepID=A0A438FZ29_VITVI|nr:hypothetical protein CK203_035774 [Vitis vinifera]